MPDRHRALSLGDVTHLVGAIVLGSAGALLLCALVGALLRDGSFLPLLLAALLAGAVGGAARYLTYPPEEIGLREAFATVPLAWTAVAFFGALPYLFSSAIPAPAAAFFESMSGFTTTGSTVLPDIEAVAPGILLWRSVTQWLGGMGIIVLGVAILPYLGVGGMQLFRMEAPGPTQERLRPRIRETAKLLWLVYGALTLLVMGLYWVGGMTFYDAVNHALTTMPTGGFSTKNASMGAFSPFIQWVAILFMFLAGINFTLHYRMLTGRGTFPYWQDREWRLYTIFILLAIALIVFSLRDVGLGWEETLRTGSFQVLAIVTTTGYGTADYTTWIPFAQVVLFLLFFVGGMAGSTSGGPKVIRVLLILKHGLLEMRRYLHPRAIMLVKVGGTPVPEPVMLNVVAFMLMYVGLFGVGTLAMAALGLDLPTSAGAAATAISNVGPGLGEVGPVENFGWIPWQGHLILSFLMLIGRLELYTVFLLFHPDLWRR